MEQVASPLRKPSALASLAPGQKVGGNRYVLKRILGQGGMGVVWLAQDRLLRDSVALKFLPPQICFDPSALEGLRRETLQARRLSHPNILRIHDLVDVANEPTFISMEYVDGVDLHTLRANRPGKVLTWHFVEPLLRQLCLALDYAHGERIIHRDLKPANLMIDSSSRVKLADFGLARVITDTVTRLSGEAHTSGTLAYMSPQQADGKKAQVTDDIYGVGATIYELLTSTPPFYAGDVSYQIRHRQPEALEVRLAELELRNDIPVSVAAMLMACLAKEPDHRPQSARAILDWLDSLESSDVPQASAPASSGTVSVPLHEENDEDACATSPTRSRTPLWLGLAALTVAGLGLWAWQFFDQHNGRSMNSSLIVAPSPASRFEVLFNGRDLSGWEGDTNFWHVENGVITGFAAEEGVKRRENTCLIWRDSVEDFELHLSFRQEDVATTKGANSGVLYRARRVPEFQMRGYEADLNGNLTGAFVLIQDGPLDTWAELGKKAVLRPAGLQCHIQPGGATAASDEVKAAFRKGEWNELTIIARGNHLIHKINGIVTAEVFDERPREAALFGSLGLEMKRATIVQFKDIRLKRL